jgi:hypothetical protein
VLSFSGSLRVFLAVAPCDMRKGFEGLTALVATQLKEELRSGALFVFTNRTHTRLKVLYWDGSGLWLLSKTHDPHCAHWNFFTACLSLSSTVRSQVGGMRRGWWIEGHGLRSAA